MDEITYTQIGDYLLPDLTISDDPQPSYGKYGLLRKRYLREHRNSFYMSLLISGKLNKHLSDTDQAVRDSVLRLAKDLAEKQGVNDTMKAQDSMAWVGAMNGIKAQAEEIVLAEYVYV